MLYSLWEPTQLFKEFTLSFKFGTTKCVSNSPEISPKQICVSLGAKALNTVCPKAAFPLNFPTCGQPCTLGENRVSSKHALLLHSGNGPFYSSWFYTGGWILFLGVLSDLTVHGPIIPLLWVFHLLIFLKNLYSHFLPSHHSFSHLFSPCKIQVNL